MALSGAPTVCWAGSEGAGEREREENRGQSPEVTSMQGPWHSGMFQVGGTARAKWRVLVP